MTMERNFPECTRDMPVCPRRKLPIPFSALRNPDGSGMFALTSPVALDECARYDLCGVCGKPNTYYKALLGGPKSADPEHGAYTDPPMHVECAEASLELCPYIAHPRVPRRSMPIELAQAQVEGFTDERASDWVMVICRQTKTWKEPARDGQPVNVWRPKDRVAVRRFSYVDGKLTEIKEAA